MAAAGSGASLMGYAGVADAWHRIGAVVGRTAPDRDTIMWSWGLA